MMKSIICTTDSLFFLAVKVAAARWQSSCSTMAVQGTDRDDVTPVYLVKRSFSGTSHHSIRQLRWACMGVCVCVHVLSCLLQMLVVSLTQRYARAYKIHMQQSTSPIVRHPAPHGKPPTLMPRKQVLVFLTLMTTNQQSCDRLNKKYSEIIGWHLTPCWKSFWWGPTPVNNFQPRNYFCMAWPMPEVYGSCMKLIIISEKLFWYVAPPWNNIAKVAVIYIYI